MSIAQRLYLTDPLRQAERAAAAGLPPGTLMARAGRAAADWIAAQTAVGPRSRLAVLCGPGNNCGDGYACAAALQALGFEPVCVALAAPASPDAQAAAGRWRGTVVSDLADASLQAVDIAVDAMFGIGLSRPLEGIYRDAARWINARHLRLSLDVPSGLDADRGIWVGGVEGVQADATLTFLAAKPGLYTADGCDAAGAVSVDSLQVDAALFPESRLALSSPPFFPTIAQPRRRNSHKGRFGDVSVVGGNTGMAGAALLAGRAALRAGAGRVLVHALGAPDLSVDPMQPELMLRSAPDFAADRVVVLGCGLGTDDKASGMLARGLQEAGKLVLDADALNLLAASPALQAMLSSSGAVRVLTPHPLEAARLLACPVQQVQHNRVAAACELAHRFASLVVLKGAGSVIATPTGDAWINPTGGPALATAGSGDVLCGLIAALWAQGGSALEATLAAVWLHGKAADRHAGDIGLVAGEIAVKAVAELAALRALHRR